MAEITRKNLHTAPKFEDLEVRVSLVTCEGREFAEIREYIPSLDRYGRGVTFQREHIEGIIAGLRGVLDG